MFFFSQHNSTKSCCSGKFDFFYELILILSRKQKVLMYLNDYNICFPFIARENRITRHFQNNKTYCAPYTPTAGFQFMLQLTV